MTSWIEVDKQSDFSIHNIPFGIFSKEGGRKKVASRIGNQVVDLAMVAEFAGKRHRAGLVASFRRRQQDVGIIAQHIRASGQRQLGQKKIS